MLSSARSLLSRRILPKTAVRCFAQGPASGGEISDELLAKLGSLSTQALVDGLWVMGWPSAQIDGARPLSPDMKTVGRAVTLNFVPARPDIAQDKVSPMTSSFVLFRREDVTQHSFNHRSLPVGSRLNMKLSKNADLMKFSSCPLSVHGNRWEAISSSFV